MSSMLFAPIKLRDLLTHTSGVAAYPPGVNDVYTKRNRTLAEEQLTLQQRRYALGASDMLLLMDAQTTMSTAEQAYLNAVYDFHYNLIALEAAVGQPLRQR
mgnify:CR=1 FL=1